jgi:hypothetical protein
MACLFMDLGISLEELCSTKYDLAYIFVHPSCQIFVDIIWHPHTFATQGFVGFF